MLKKTEQKDLFSYLAPNNGKFSKAVNVASVPQRSPFRYPGGKTWFVPTFRKWLISKSYKPKLLIEPFAGGGIISLTALFEDLVERVLMVELDEQIAAFWQAVVDGQCDWIANKILNFELTYENAKNEIKKKYKDEKKIAFQTILKNRTFHGGILADGSGFLKYGEQGRGIHSRWYPQTIAKRIRSLNFVLNRIEFKREDGLQVIKDNSGKNDVIYFIDPPYTVGGKKAGRRLYKYFELNHDRLFQICKGIKGDFVMTYDNSEEVKNLANKYGFQFKSISMKNTHHIEMTELVIGKNLSWMDDFC